MLLEPDGGVDRRRNDGPALEIGLAVLILLERAWSRSGPLVRASGFALLVAGCLVPWLPALAPALHGMS